MLKGTARNTGLLMLMLPAFAAHAQDSVEPYIDELRQEYSLQPEPESAGSYTGTIQKDLRSRDEASESAQGVGYSEEIRGSLEPEPAAPSSYTEELKRKLGPPETGGAIEAFHQGRSELSARRGGEIHSMLGVKLGAGLSYDVSAAAGYSGRLFDGLYGGRYAPTLSLLYEYQPYHSEWFGNFGLWGSTGVSYHHGAGTFEFPLVIPGSSERFTNQSETKFQFFTVPISLGLDYRFNLLRIFRPYVMAGGSLIPFWESRNDTRSGYRGVSRAVTFTGGVSVLLDWISADSSWDFYSAWGVKHYYLTIDYTRLMTIASSIDFSISGLNAGLAFEF